MDLLSDFFSRFWDGIGFLYAKCAYYIFTNLALPLTDYGLSVYESIVVVTLCFTLVVNILVRSYFFLKKADFMKEAG